MLFFTVLHPTLCSLIGSEAKICGLGFAYLSGQIVMTGCSGKAVKMSVVIDHQLPWALLRLTSAKKRIHNYFLTCCHKLKKKSIISMISWLGYCHVWLPWRNHFHNVTPSHSCKMFKRLIGLKSTGQIRFPLALMHLAEEWGTRIVCLRSYLQVRHRLPPHAPPMPPHAPLQAVCLLQCNGAQSARAANEKPTAPCNHVQTNWVVNAN